MDQLPALLGPPDHLLVQQLTAALAKRFDDARALLEVVPELPRVDELHLLLAVAQHLAQARVVKEQTALLVDDDQACRAVFEDLAKLPLLLGDLRLALSRR